MQNIHRINKNKQGELPIQSLNPRTSAIHMWPAKKSLVYDGWILRFLNPYTYRCNCIYPLKKGKLTTSEKIKKCASMYQQNGYQYLFQIMPHDKKLDILLSASGYKKTIQTKWMAKNLDAYTENILIKPKNNCVIRLSNAWLEHRQAIADYSQQQASIYETFYHAINVQSYPMVLLIDNLPVSCGMGIQVGKYLGIFDIRTKYGYLRQGHASLLVRAICKHAKKNGAMHAQLHVKSDNHAAIHLYHRLEFHTICDYWFRKKERGIDPC